jgi:hypothetical protein
MQPLRRYSRFFWLALVRLCQSHLLNKLTGEEPRAEAMTDQEAIAFYIFCRFADEDFVQDGPDNLWFSNHSLRHDDESATYYVKLADSAAASLREVLTDDSTIERAQDALGHLGQLTKECQVRRGDFVTNPPVAPQSSVLGFRELLQQLAAEQKLPADAASILLEPAGSSDSKYVRCVAVATWPPAWLEQEALNQQQQDDLAAASSSSSSNSGDADASSSSADGSSSGAGGSSHVLWVTDKEWLANDSDVPDSGNTPRYTLEQGLMLEPAGKQESSQEGDALTVKIFDAKVSTIEARCGWGHGYVQTRRCFEGSTIQNGVFERDCRTKSQRPYSVLRYVQLPRQLSSLEVLDA